MLVALNRESKIPLYLQLADALLALFEGENIAPESLLPSIRDFALQLGVSKFTVEKAYRALAQQGLVKVRRAHGTFFKKRPKSRLRAENENSLECFAPLNECTLSEYGQNLNALNSTSAFDELEVNGLQFDPEKTIIRWGETMTRVQKTLSDPSVPKNGLANLELRKLIAKYASRSRGIDCSYEQVLLFNGKLAALDAIARILVDEESMVAIEEPSCPRVRAIFKANGAYITPIVCDSSGMRVEDLIAAIDPRPIVYLAPNSNVFGQQLSESRRTALLEWAREKRRFIVEDDCGHELRYSATQNLPLKANDLDGSVIYLSDFEDVMLSAIDCAYLILPHNLVGVFERDQSLTRGGGRDLNQAALSLFIADGFFDRHAQRLRMKYLRRRRLLIEAVNARLFELAAIRSSGKTSLIVQFDHWLSPDRILSCAKECNLFLQPTRPLYLADAPPGEMQISFTDGSEDSMIERLECFAANLKLLKEEGPQTSATPFTTVRTGLYSLPQ